MRGARVKALRRAFIAEHGRPPERMRWVAWNRYVTSEWRRVKKAHRRASATSRTFSSARVILAAHQNELRRMRKCNARKRRRAA